MRWFVLCAAFAAACLGSVGSVSAGTHLGLRHPALSPDGSQIAFSYHGDIWIAPAAGGVARRLTDHVGSEERPIWTRDGRQIVYTADHYGQHDLFVVSTDGTGLRRLTFSAANDLATGISRDNKHVVFHSNRENTTSLYTVPLAGGRVQRLLPGYWTVGGHGAYGNAGDDLLFTTSYESLFFFWRKGYRGSFSADIWRLRKDGTLSAVLQGPENELWPMWGAADRAIYYVSAARNKTYNIWRWSSGRREPVTHFKEGNVRWPSIGAGGTAIVFERNFRLWRLDLATGRSRELSFDLIVAPKDNGIKRYPIEGQISEFAIAPDGKKVALVAKGQLWVTGTKGGVSRRLTRATQSCKHLSWSKDSRAIAYVSDRDGITALYLVQADGSLPPKKLKEASEPLYQPQFAPDGKRISYMLGKIQLRVIGSDGSGDRLVVRDLLGGRFSSGYDWSPDGKWIAYTQNRGFSGEVILKEVEGKRRINLTRSGFSDFNPHFTSDGKHVYFTANRHGHKWPYHTGRYDAYLVSLQRRGERFDEDTFDRLFTVTKTAKKKGARRKPKPKQPLRIDLDQIHRRVSQLTYSKGDDRMVLQSPKHAKIFVFVSNVMGGGWELYRTSADKNWKGGAPKRISSGLNVRQFEFLPDGKTLVALSKGRLYSVGVLSGGATKLSVKGSMRFTRASRFTQMFNEVWQSMQHYFYDKSLHHANWKALRRRFQPLIGQLQTISEFVHLMNEMVGHLNASHTGLSVVNKRSVQQPAGVLGVDFQPNSYRIARVVKGGPLARAVVQDLAGWELARVDGAELDETRNLPQLLGGKIGKRVVLQLKQGGKTLTVKVKPTSYGRLRSLRYRRWEAARKQFVKKGGGGRIGYVHLPAMGLGDYQKFNRALEHDLSDKEAVIIDLRFNHGGNVHDQVLALMKKRLYARWRIRGMNMMPQPFHAIGHKPIVLLVNEVTLSDGEMTAAGFKALKLGTIIGNNTYGWLIFTTNVRMLWGASYRLPFWGCYSVDGKNLERPGGVAPDIRVVNTIADRVAGRDPQLQRALEFLREKLRSRR